MVEQAETTLAEEILDQSKGQKLVDEGTRMLNGREADNALLDSIKRKGSQSYYYAHAPKDFT